MKNSKTRPTDSELEVLTELWDKGPLTVRQVNEELSMKKGAVGYTTTLKIMQIMIGKGLLGRDDTKRTHVYFPLVKEKDTRNVLIKKFLDAAFEGSAKKLMMQLLGNQHTSKKELEEIKNYIKEIEGGKND